MIPLPAWLLTGLQDSTLAATAVFLMFILQYTDSSPWWGDPVGTTIVVKDLFILGILVPSSIDLLWPGVVSSYALAIIETSMLTGATGAMLWRCVVWYRIRPPRHDAGRLLIKAVRLIIRRLRR